MTDRERTSTTYNFIRCRQLENTFPDDPMTGVWITTSCRVSRGWGCVLEYEWPQVVSAKCWPPLEPPGLDEKAKSRRVNRYLRIRSADDCRKAIQRTGLGVVAAFEITKDWYTAPNGVIPMPAEAEPCIGGHTVCLATADEVERVFCFPNSWGKEWGLQEPGYRGWGCLSFEFFDRYMTEAWLMSNIAENPPITTPDEGVQHVCWEYSDYLGRDVYVIDVCDLTKDERIGWCIAIHTGNAIEVEEFFVKPAFRHQKVGSFLMDMLMGFASHRGLPLSIWLSHPDCSLSNFQGTKRFLSKFGFSITNSGVRWASGLAGNNMDLTIESLTATPKQGPRIFIPDRSSIPEGL